MIKKIVIIFSFLLVFICVFQYKPEEPTGSLYYTGDLNSPVTELLEKNLDTELTIQDVLLLYCRLNKQNVEDLEELKGYCSDIVLPAQRVYSIEDWEEMWLSIIQGNTLFERVSDETYCITLIQGYLKIYLNEVGYNYIKKGLIPPQVYMYSPFSSIETLDTLNFESKCTQGMALDIIARLLYGDVEEEIKGIVIKKVESLTGISEDGWTAKEIALFDYYSLSYYGTYTILEEELCLDLTLEDLSKGLTYSKFCEYIGV